MRLPIGSVPPSGAAKRMAPEPTMLFGTVSVSITFVHTPGLRAAKYSPAARTSASEIAFAISIIAFALTPFLSPFLNAAIWRTRYVVGSPARLEDSGWPSPDGRWHTAQARAGFLPMPAISGVAARFSGNHLGGLDPSAILGCLV